MDQQLHVDAATMAYLDEHGIEVYVHETREAVTVYNNLSNHAPVGGLFHSTC
jgi:hypothetical protein